MTVDEHQFLHGLQDIVRIYRGHPFGLEEGLSWTLSPEIAYDWAVHHDESGHVATGLVRKEFIIAYFNRRGEDEVMVQPEHVMDLVSGRITRVLAEEGCP